MIGIHARMHNEIGWQSYQPENRDDGADFLLPFKSKRQTKLGWDLVAKCSNSRERWTANVSLSVKDNRLSWKSQRGT